MMISQELAQYQLPDLEDPFTTSEIHELFSFFQPEQQSIKSTSSLESIPLVYSIEEKKRKRMKSNRESAKRSRWRKKRHLENLTTEADHLKLENRKLKNQLCMMTNEYHLVQRDTNWLTVECIELQQRLAGLYQILLTMQLC
ncbi:basic leucine-zipper 6 [Abeliophyllum distichum]|uniref:Basic leucine-zipper 6 n=1 Tax=Abeliophyllum distichum TaxID=126358 RepID=A0ABD1Q5Q5_9LAMI